MIPSGLPLRRSSSGPSSTSHVISVSSTTRSLHRQSASTSHTSQHMFENAAFPPVNIFVPSSCQCSSAAGRRSTISSQKQRGTPFPAQPQFFSSSYNSSERCSPTTLVWPACTQPPQRSPMPLASAPGTTPPTEIT